MDAVAVQSADYISFQRRNEESAYWWAARNRQELKNRGMNIWLQIAKRSHAHLLGWGLPPLPVFELAVNQTEPIKEWTPDGLDQGPPGFPIESLNIVKDEIDAGNCCPACGFSRDSAESSLRGSSAATQYCSRCFYIWSSRHETSKGCDQLHPHVDGSLNSSNITLRCPDCGQEEDPPEGYAKQLVDEYQPIFKTMEYAVPIDL